MEAEEPTITEEEVIGREGEGEDNTAEENIIRREREGRSNITEDTEGMQRRDKDRWQ